MAKQYFATSKIVHGDAPNEDKVFQPGDVVEGLSKEAMVALWEAGVLTERDPDDEKPDERDKKIADLELELSKLRADKTNAENAVPEGESPAGDAEVVRDTVTGEIIEVKESEKKEETPAPKKATTPPAK